MDIKELDRLIRVRAEAVQARVIAWRREIHQHPELGNREFRTAAIVADHLQRLGIAVRTGVAHTGVVGTLGSGDPAVALRADMDALPVSEAVDLPFASRVRTTWDGQEVGVMHACGHDAHVAILMGVAEVLASVRDRLRGAVKFIFQPAEEGAPAGERGGAELMIEEGVLDHPKPSAIFGLHVSARHETGTIAYRPGPQQAATDTLRVVVRGRQTHAAYPWLGVDPIVVASQIILAFQTIPSRQLNLTVAPAVLTIGQIRGGVRNNIIPESVELLGTIRTLDEGMRKEMHERITRTAQSIAAGAGGTAEVSIQKGYPATFNDPALTSRMLPTLQKVAEKIVQIDPVLGSEDFAFFQQSVPGLFFYLGVRPKGTPAEAAAPNHSSHFFVDESALVLGVRALAHLAVDSLHG